MKILLRPHHLLCLKGYKGYNYNKIQRKSWDIVSSELKKQPDTDILIVSGADDLCSNCLSHTSATKMIRCLDSNVNVLDKKTEQLLHIFVGETYKYSELVEKLKQKINYEKHKELCSTCAWWKKGLCTDSFKK